jgi:hypothetical protein
VGGEVKGWSLRGKRQMKMTRRMLAYVVPVSLNVDASRSTSLGGRKIMSNVKARKTWSGESNINREYLACERTKR